ncbi:MAG: endonuclease/exonuclease/phosphatase family protein [Bacteroidaceae bacterium]|nr:endonuclease/exonuclease/phosphatase family protein [Bacteroidaceae bacterium]
MKLDWIKRLLLRVFEGANVAVILLLWLAVALTYLSPESFPRLSLLSLAFPVFLFTNLAFVAFWLIFKAKRVWIPIVGIALCFSFVRDYCPVNLASEPADSSLTVISFNTHGFGGSEAADDEGNNLIVRYLANRADDIICLQETYTPTHVQALSDSLSQRGYHEIRTKSLACFTRLPVIDNDEIRFDSQSNSSLCAHLLWGTDTILLINNHFESNHFSPEMKQRYVDALEQTANPNSRNITPDSLIGDVKPLLHLLSEAAPKRAVQVNTIDSIVNAWLPRPVILCGDFNDTPVSYTHRVLTRQLTSAFRQSGNGLGLTFREQGFPVRIDHILFSPQHWTSHTTRVDGDMTLSDHSPIYTVLSPKSNR